MFAFERKLVGTKRIPFSTLHSYLAIWKVSLFQLLSCCWSADEHVTENNSRSVRISHCRHQREGASDRWVRSTSRNKVPQDWTPIIYRQPWCPFQRAVRLWADLSPCVLWLGRLSVSTTPYTLSISIVRFLSHILIHFILFRSLQFISDPCNLFGFIMIVYVWCILSSPRISFIVLGH